MEFTAAKAIYDQLWQIFGWFGPREVLVSDNDLQFSSKFYKFCVDVPLNLSRAPCIARNLMIKSDDPFSYLKGRWS